MFDHIRPLQPLVGVSALSSPLEVGADRAPQAAKDLAEALKGVGCQVIELEAVDTPPQAVAAGRQLAEAHVDAVALASASWYEDYLVLDLLEECAVPLLVWSLPGMETGALCGTQQLTSFLKHLEKSYCCVYGPIGEGQCLDKARIFVRAAALRNQLRRARVGMAGHRVGGMTHTSPNEFALKKAIGPRVVPVDLPQLLERAEEISDQQARPLWEEMLEAAAECQVSDAEGLDSMQVYLALREIVKDEKLDAVTVGCYPHLMGRVCLAASRLADEGVPFACEGDINGAVGQLILTKLTDQPTHHTDWLEPLEDETVIFTHCGSGSFSLAENPEDITLGSVRLMGQGVCALFPSRPGPVTLASLVPYQDGYQCAVIEGEAVSTEMVFPGNPLRVRFARPVDELIEWIHQQGIGHHWMAGYGHVGAELRALAAVSGPSFRLIEA